MSSLDHTKVSIDALDASMSPLAQSDVAVAVVPRNEIVDDTELIESSDKAPPLVQPKASRLSSCLRASCLKRTSSVSPVTSPTSTGTSACVSPDGGNSSAPSSGDETAALGGSFSAIKRVIGAKPCTRQVHFDVAPPLAGITHSGDLYDRRPIECTRRGEENDLSLPPRGTCQLYTDDADDESGTNDDDDEEEASSAERLRGFARWSRLKNHYGVSKMTSVLSPTFATPPQASSDNSSRGSLLSESEDASEGSKLAEDGDSASIVEDGESAASVIEMTFDDEEDRNTCSQPFHGVRSFGRISDRPDEPHIHASKGYDERVLASSEDGITKQQRVAEEEDEDPEHEAFKQAVYAALALSPNATPMPSPSVRSRWESVTSYFDADSSATGISSGKSSGSTTPGPGITIVDEMGHADVVKAQGSELILSPQSTINEERDEDRNTPSPSIEESTAASSPLSSRSSSADTSNSPGDSTLKLSSPTNAFESAFAMHGLSGFNLASSSLHSQGASGSRVNDVLTHRSIPYRASSEESEPFSCASSSTSGGTFAASKSGSCSTSPDLGCNDPDFGDGMEKSTPTRTPTMSGSELSYDAHVDASGSPDAKEVVRDSNSPIERSGVSALELGVPSPLEKFRATARNGELSPCVQSADERDHERNDAALHAVRSDSKSPSFSLMPDPSMASTMLRRSSSSSGATRKTKRNPRRVASSGCEGEQSSRDGSGSTTPEDGEKTSSSSRSRSNGRSSRSSVGTRSKSMSSAQPSSIKRSSFASTTFRSEIDDDGALGGF